MRSHVALLLLISVFVGGCSNDASERSEGQPSSRPTRSTPAELDRLAESAMSHASEFGESRLAPDLVGLTRGEALQVLGEFEENTSDWGRPKAVRCGTRPRTVVSQRPQAGEPLGLHEEIHVREAAMDLDEFRGPCEVHATKMGSISESDAALAAKFYRFASDPFLAAPFASDGVWVGIGDAPTASRIIQPADLGDAESWVIRTSYAESFGPFSALDLVAASGGYFELHEGINGLRCPGEGTAPEYLEGLRAVSLAAPSDVVTSCMESWSITLFLDPNDHIKGVSLRHGAP